MKKLLTILLLLITINLNSQISNNHIIPDSLHIDLNKEKFTPNQIMAGTCTSPDGNMNSIAAPPPNYTYLQNNGYCNPRSYGKNGTVCWSFTPTSNSVTINSGYSSSGCSTISFGPFILYRCSPLCSVVGSGLSFSVVSGTCYTWCMSWSATGPPSCDITDWCPYFQQFTTLPIELGYFAGSNQGHINVLQWKTELERNNDYFILEISDDALNWSVLANIRGNGNTNSSIIYNYKHKGFNNIVNYYRLKQVDYNGSYKYHGIIVINNVKDADIKVVKVLNILGQEVSFDYEGIKIVYYSDGSVLKQN